jgi:hypothetical protein
MEGRKRIDLIAGDRATADNVLSSPLTEPDDERRLRDGAVSRGSR